MPHHVTLNRLPTSDSALDFAQLHQLRRQVQTVATPAGRPAAKTDVKTHSTTGARQADAQVARQFEALFIAQLLKQARQTSEDSGASLFDSPQTQMVQSLGDAQLAQQLSTPGIGLAQVLLLQMRRATNNMLGVGNGGAGASVTHAPDPAARHSRLHAHRPGARAYDAASITELIARLTGTVTGTAAGAIAGQTTVTATKHLATTANAVVHAVREAPRHIHAFVERVSNAVRLAAQESGVPAKLILSQAALESAWGRHEIRHPDGTPTHNLFGIKATPNWNGKVAHVTTTEYRDGQARRMTQAFRAYDSYDEAFADYARLIGTSERYRMVMQAPTPEDAARRVQEAGYATDPDYADKLIGIMGVLREAGAAGDRPRAA